MKAACYQRLVAVESEPFGEVTGALRVHLPIDDPWRIACEKRLAEMGQTQGALAAWVGCSQGNISQAWSLEDGQKTSQYAHAISLALGVDLPVRSRLQLLTHHLEASGTPEATKAVLSSFELLAGLPLIKPPKSGT